MKCKWCNSEFAPKRSTQVYCSKNCCDRDHQQPKQRGFPRRCKFCHKEFLPKWGNERYCEPCRAVDARHLVYGLKRRHNGKGTIPSRYCWAALARSIIKEESPDEALRHILEVV